MKKGQLVYHEKFGRGIVVKANRLRFASKYRNKGLGEEMVQTRFKHWGLQITLDSDLTIVK
tara:strand:- start:1693 stop:1875 length:183 start_codon:yes stop_codon:yes gene_type:complete